MEPKFQSSFIPKGPIATSGTATRTSMGSNRSFLGTLSVFVFGLSLFLCLAVFGYEKYLGSRIGTMGQDLITAKATLQPDVITSLANLDARLVSTAQLLDKHTVLSPFFDFLEVSTLRNVRFTEFNFQDSDKGLLLTMRGQARGYAAVAQQANIFNKSPYLKGPIFSDLDLDDKGNVTFSFKATVDPSIVSYKLLVETNKLTPPQTPTQASIGASTSTPVKTLPVKPAGSSATSTSTSTPSH